MPTLRTQIAENLLASTYFVTIKMLGGELGEQEVLSTYVEPGNALSCGDEQARAKERVHAMLMSVKDELVAAFRGKSPEDFFLLACETVEHALLYLHATALQHELFTLRPFLFPYLVQFPDAAKGKLSEKYPEYAKRAEEGNPYRIAVLVAVGSDAECVRAAFGEQEEKTASVCNKLGELFDANELFRAGEKNGVVHIGHPTTNI